jgi:hypothetical protein
MHVLNRSARVCLMAALTVIVPVGCGPSAAGPESPEELKIMQISQLFHIYQRGQKPPPQGINDAESLRQVVPAAVAAIRSKEYIVYWGVGVSDGPEASSTVLAYQKDVPEKGGEVLMQDGKATKMTAEEFKAAKKPVGAKTDGEPADKKSLRH